MDATAKETESGQSIDAIFDIDGDRRVPGRIHLKRGKYGSADLWDDKVIKVGDQPVLYGISPEGKVSLTDCHGRPGSVGWGDFTLHRSYASYQYAVFGAEHLDPEDRCIAGIQFTFDEIDTILCNDRYETYGLIHGPANEIIDAIENNRETGHPASFSRDGSALVSYFSGKTDILPATSTVLGTVHAFRAIHCDMGEPRMGDRPLVSIHFDDNPTDLETAYEKMRTLRQFFAWLIGFPPTPNEVNVFKAKSRENPSPEMLRVICTSDVVNSMGEPPLVYSDVLLDASRKPDDFTKVMCNWLNRNTDEKRKSANTRFFGALLERRYLEDGMTSSANTFDLLPKEDKPSPTPLSEDVEDILGRARTEIGDSAAPGEEREQILNQLGRIRANKNLRQVVENRANLIIDSIGDSTLPNLQRVIRQAVLCRNYYTHGKSSGSNSSVDFANDAIVCFLADTLEFVYGTSELLLCGWDMKEWLKRSQFHRFSEYVRNYKQLLKKLNLL